MTERIDLDPADAPWLHTLVQRVRSARADGDDEEASRLVEYGRAEGGDALTRLFDQIMASLDERDAAHARGETMPPFAISAAAEGQLECDFCAALNPTVYFEVTEFGVQGPGGTFLSGDRFYACPRCRQLVEADDWKGMREWIGPKRFGLGSRMLVMGFRQHRKGGAVEFEPGTNPEASR
ncbi:hypothetical protein ACFV2X_42990 [Streptomyces sp. NPDC059679]|uniref:hypothetical protein n=1 Tax=Streptomyces sp. NPDC059679 TaxID=3346903 RepID=UPI00369E3636